MEQYNDNKWNSPLDAALYYLSIGMHPIPIEPNGKIPLIKWRKYQKVQPTEEEVREWFEGRPDVNIGLITGTPSGLLVIDIDEGHAPWPPKGQELNSKYVVETPGGGLHAHYRNVEGIHNSASKLARGIDVRGKGGCIVAPPSVINGIPYKIKEGSLEEALKTDPPRWLVDALLSAGNNTVAQISSGGKIPEGRRNDTLFKRGCSMRARGMKEVPLFENLSDDNATDCVTPLQVEEVEDIFESVCKYPRGPERRNTGRINRAEELTRLIESEIQEFFQDQHGDPYVLIQTEDGSELQRVSKGSFSPRLTRHYRDHFGDVPAGGIVSRTIQQIQARCLTGDKRELFLRVAWEDERLYYNLSWKNNRAIEITADGWQLTGLPPIFKHYQHQIPQVEPVKGGELNRIWEFVNIAPADRHLFLAVVASWFIPGISHPVMILHGQPGTGKTTTAKFIKQVVDPSPVLTGGIPRDDKDIGMQFNQNWLVCFDNLNHLKPWLSDTLCRAVTGEGKYTRQLYTDDTPFLTQYQRCICLNGIGSPVTRDDLLDRSVVIRIDRPEHRRAETVLMKGWAKELPGILGVFFRAISIGIRNLSSISEEQPFRMADFARWGKAIAPGLGFSVEEFEAVYRRSIASKWTESLETNPFSAAIVSLVGRNGRYWEGTASELSQALAADVRLSRRDITLFSLDPRWISEELTRITPALEHYGIKCTRLNYQKVDGKVRRKTIRLSQITEEGEE